jgi:hypothetical protein
MKSMSTSDKSRVEVEVFNVDSFGNRVHIDHVEGERAYDVWMLWQMGSEIEHYHRYSETGATDLLATPRLDKNLMLYLLARVMGGGSDGCRMIELGSTLLEVIDGLEMVDDHMMRVGRASASIGVQKMSFHGVEISDFLSRMSRRLHPNHDVALCSDWRQVVKGADILYDRAVSSYACRSTSELVELMSLARVTFANLFVSRGETFQTHAVGHSITYFSLAELDDATGGQLYHLYGKRNPKFDRSGGRDVVEGFFLKADPATAQAFMALAAEIPETAEFFRLREIKLTPARELLQS